MPNVVDAGAGVERYASELVLQVVESKALDGKHCASEVRHFAGCVGMIYQYEA